MLLVAEIGNTTAVFAVFSKEVCLEVFKVPTTSLSVAGEIDCLIGPFLAKHPSIREAAFCSVVPGVDLQMLDLLGNFSGSPPMQVASSLKLPFTLHYDSPATFGPDRIALCAFCRQRYPGEAVIAIDIGTAITFDVLGSGGDYLGGLIVPGLDLMAKALHEHTARLPLVRIGQPGSITGFSTEECIRNGIVWSSAAGIEGLVARIRRSLQEESGDGAARVLVTGGNGQLLSGMIGLSADLDELAVLRGTRFLFELNRL